MELPVYTLNVINYTCKTVKQKSISLHSYFQIYAHIVLSMFISFFYVDSFLFDNHYSFHVYSTTCFLFFEFYSPFDYWFRSFILSIWHDDIYDMLRILWTVYFMIQFFLSVVDIASWHEDIIYYEKAIKQQTLFFMNDPLITENEELFLLIFLNLKLKTRSILGLS